MREPLNVPEERLRACLRDNYDLSDATLEFLPLGLDTRAGVYRVVSAQGMAYLLKVKAGSLYTPSCLVPRYLRDQGIAAVVAPLPTKRNALWSRVGEREKWALIVYPFYEGASGWHPSMTDAQWMAVGSTLRQIHQAPLLPPEDIPSLRRETFDTTEYGRWVRAFDADDLYLAHQAHGEGRSRAELRQRWLEYQPTIHTMLTAMETLAGALRGRSGPHVICHADLHPSNMIRDHAGHVYVVDWDDVMLAPKERDFLFVAVTPADGSARDSTSPFLRGYGQVEIDWAALTYYRFERVVQDVIECAQQVLVRDELGEAIKAHAVELFGQLFAPGSMIAAAWAAAAHLPAALSLRTGAP